MKGVFIGLGLLILMVWCSVPDGSKTEMPITASAPPVASQNPAHDILIGMTDDKRTVMLTNFLKGSQEDCDAVVRNFYQGGVDHELRKAHWNVACRNGKSYDIMIEPDKVGSTKIIPCAMLAFLKSTPCFQKFEG
jgi:hypothetical protein